MKITLTPSDDFDKALNLNRDPGTEFVLTKGIYKTKGNWYFNEYTTLASGCKLYGEGSTLMLSDDAVKQAAGVIRLNRDLNVIWTNPNTVVENLIVDGNEQFYNNVDPTKAWHVTSGIRGRGKCEYRNITVKNIRGSLNGIGTPVKQIESFGISTVGPDGGSIIEDCKVIQCPENSYVSSITSGHYGTNIAQSFIIRCDVNVGNGNWYGYSVNQNVVVSNCKITNGCIFAIYNDTDNVDNVLIKNCEFNNVDKLISLITVSNKNEFRKNIRIKDTKVVYSTGPIKHLVEMWDKNSDLVKRQLGPVLLDNVEVVLSDPLSKLYVACVGNDIKSVVCMDCKIPYKIETSGQNVFAQFS